MPSKGGNRKSNSKNSQDWQKFDFVEVRLEETQKSEFKANYAKDANMYLGLVSETLSTGYKLSVSYSEENKTFLASLTCKEPLDANFNYVMTSRSGDAWEAIALAMYKHHFVCDDNDWGAETRMDDRNWG